MVRVFILGDFVCLFTTLGYVFYIEGADALEFFLVHPFFIVDLLIVENGALGVEFFSASVNNIDDFFAFFKDDSVGIFRLWGEKSTVLQMRSISHFVT